MSKLSFVKRLRIKCRRYIHPLCAVFFALGGVALLCHVLAWLSPSFADFFNRRIAALFRGALAYLTAWIPFSLAEILLLLLPIGLGLLAYAAYRASHRHITFMRLLCTLLSVLFVFYAAFVLTLGTGYATTPIDEQLGLADTPVNADSLYETALWLAEEAAALTPSSNAKEGQNSTMPFTRRQMNQKLLDAYDTLYAQNDFIQRLHVPVKPVLLSYPMSYTHITGVYAFFTGEANLNTAFPDYSTVFTAAHEMAHQRGIAREDEANFVAFLVCMASNDDYIRYAGYLNVLQYVMNALYQVDRTRFEAVWATYPPTLVHEMLAYNDFCTQFEGSLIGDVSNAVNDGYLQAVGGGGAVSYSKVVDLAVALHASLR